MKKQIVKLLTLLLFASIALQGCSVEYRQRHRREVDERHQHDHDHDRDNDHNYRNY